MSDDVRVAFVINGNGWIVSIKAGIRIHPTGPLIDDIMDFSIIEWRNALIIFDVRQVFHAASIDHQRWALVDIDPRVGAGPYGGRAGSLDAAPGPTLKGPGLDGSG